MEAISQKNLDEKLHLKVINNRLNNRECVQTRININTLYPGFSYRNSNGENIAPTNHVYL